MPGADKGDFRALAHQIAALTAQVRRQNQASRLRSRPGGGGGGGQPRKKGRAQVGLRGRFSLGQAEVLGYGLGFSTLLNASQFLGQSLLTGFRGGGPLFEGSFGLQGGFGRNVTRGAVSGINRILEGGDALAQSEERIIQRITDVARASPEGTDLKPLIRDLARLFTPQERRLIEARQQVTGVLSEPEFLAAQLKDTTLEKVINRLIEVLERAISAGFGAG